MKVINSINYNIPVKNNLYETLNNRNEVKKDNAVVTESIATNELNKIGYTSNILVYKKTPSKIAITENLLLKDMRELSEKQLVLMKDFSDCLKEKNINFEVVSLKAQEQVAQYASFLKIENPEEYIELRREIWAPDFLSLIKYVTELHPKLLNRFEEGIKYLEPEADMAMFNCKSLTINDCGLLSILYNRAILLNQGLKNIGSIISNQSDDLQKDLLKKAEVILSGLDKFMAFYHHVNGLFKEKNFGEIIVGKKENEELFIIQDEELRKKRMLLESEDKSYACLVQSKACEKYELNSA